LAQAIDDLHAELEERPELTSDTKGVPGSPDIVATILDKIDRCAVFVADVTPIAFSESRKAVANPNVLIELGYAKKSRGLHRILLVWNTAFEGTTPEELPFDMRTRRAPISFRLPIGASREQLGVERNALKEILKDALRASLTAGPGLAMVAPEWQPASGNMPALWFDPAEPLLLNEGGGSGRKTVEPGPYSYARIIPSKWSRPLNFGEQHAHILGRTMGFSWGMTRGGFITYTGSIRSTAAATLTNLTMQFRTTGELWGVDPVISGNGFFWSDYVISSFNDFLAANLSYLIGQGASAPFHVRLGATDLEGLNWGTATHWGGQYQALESRVETHFTLSSEDEDERLGRLEQAWGEFSAAFGVRQPDRETLVKQIESGRR